MSTQIIDVETRTSSVVHVKIETDEFITPEYANIDKQFHPDILRFTYVRNDDGSWYTYGAIAYGALLKKGGAESVLRGKRSWDCGWQKKVLKPDTPAWVVELADRYTPQF